MIFRGIVIAGIFLLASPAFGWTKSMTGTSDTYKGAVKDNRCAYIAYTSTGDDCIAIDSPVAIVSLNADVAGTTKTGVTGRVWSCPNDLLEGANPTDVDVNQCELAYYKDSSDVVQSELTGDPATGRDHLLDVKGPIICVEATLVPRQIAFTVCAD